MSFKEVIAKYRHLASDSEDPELSDILTDIERAFEQELAKREKAGQPAEVEHLRAVCDRAKQKMLYEQESDPNCVWTEFEMLIYTVEDFLDAQTKTG